METQNTKKPLLKEADLLQMFSKLMEKWKFIFKVTAAFMVLGLVMALLAVKDYTSEVVVAPETSSSSQLSGGLGSFASLLGVNMGAMADDDAIYPMLYPDIVQSLPFLASLLDVRVVSEKDSIDTTYSHYIREQRKLSLFESISKGVSKGMKSMAEWIGVAEKKIEPAKVNPYNLTRKQMAMIQNLNSQISIFVDKKTNVITLSFTDRNPHIAALMADTIMARLQQSITEYRTKKAMMDCEYIQKMYDKSKEEYETAQVVYAEYCDRNRHVQRESALIERSRLSADKELKNQLYTQWAQQLQLSKAKVQEYIPAFTTLKPAAVPVLASSVRRLTILVVYTFLGGVLAVMYVLFKDSAIDLYNKLISTKKK